MSAWLLFKINLSFSSSTINISYALNNTSAISAEVVTVLIVTGAVLLMCTYTFSKSVNKLFISETNTSFPSATGLLDTVLLYPLSPDPTPNNAEIFPCSSLYLDCEIMSPTAITFPF